MPNRELQAIGLFVGEDSQFIELHGPGDQASGLEVIHAPLIHQVIARQQGFNAPAVRLSAKSALGGILRSLVIDSRIRSRRNLILGPAVDLAAEAAGHVVGAHRFRADFIECFRLNFIAIELLVILEVSASDASPGVGGSPDKGGAEGPLGLVYLGARDLIDKAFVIVEGFLRMGDLDIHGAPGGNGLQIL